MNEARVRPNARAVMIDPEFILMDKPFED